MKPIYACCVLAVAVFAAGSLAGCSQDVDGGTQGPALSVGFASSLVPDTLSYTRAGRVGAMTEATLQRASFGVFAYHTGSTPWSSYYGASMQAPNFMYNQKVDFSFTQGTWGYTPVKYWPNDNTPADDEGAVGSLTHSYLSFFAYAPYVALTQNGNRTLDAAPTDDAGVATPTGITAISGDGVAGTGTTGNLWVSYRLAEDPDKQVDLMYGTRGQKVYQEADGTNNTVAELGASVMNTDLAKQTVGEQVNFLFRHALSTIDIYVQRIYDEVLPTGKTPETEKTRIYVSQLSLAVPAGGMYDSGRFNLITGRWNLSGGTKNATAYTHTSNYDYMAEELRGVTADNSNLSAVQAVELNDFAKKAGVTETATRLYTNAYASLLIPTDADGSTLAGVSLTPTISYNIVTEDDDLLLGLANSDGTHRYARLQNTVTGAPVTIGTYDSGTGTYRLEAGKRYILVCYIGAEHVSFKQVGVVDWDFPLRFHLSSMDFIDTGAGTIINHGLNED